MLMKVIQNLENRLKNLHASRNILLAAVDKLDAKIAAVERQLELIEEQSEESLFEGFEDNNN